MDSFVLMLPWQLRLLTFPLKCWREEVAAVEVAVYLVPLLVPVLLLLGRGLLSERLFFSQRLYTRVLLLLLVPLATILLEVLVSSVIN
jgi:hypothetical protein